MTAQTPLKPSYSAVLTAGIGFHVSTERNETDFRTVWWTRELGETSEETNEEARPQVSKKRNYLTARKFTGSVHSPWVPKGGKIWQ